MTRALADSDTSNDHDADTPTGTNVQVGDGADNTISGGNGKDTLYGAGGNDTLHGDNGVDAVYGQAGNDTLNGDNGDDTLYGGSGDDVLVGGGGADELWGGSGNDTFRFTAAGDSPSNTVDTIQDFHHGFDKIDVTQINSGDGGAGDFSIRRHRGHRARRLVHGRWREHDPSLRYQRQHWQRRDDDNPDGHRPGLDRFGFPPLSRDRLGHARAHVTVHERAHVCFV